PWPKFPAEAVTSGGEFSARLDTRKSVPRPLKQRIGLIVSTFRRTRIPSGSLSNWGEFRNTGSIERDAASIRSSEILEGIFLRWIKKFVVNRILHDTDSLACEDPSGRIWSGASPAV